METFVGLRLYEDADGVRRLDAVLKEGVVRLVLEASDLTRPLGYYDMNWHPASDPAKSAA